MSNFCGRRKGGKNEKLKIMKIIDLSRTITPGMQVFPGDMAPTIERLEASGFRAANISLCSHTGTHIDAPAHLASCSKTLDVMPPSAFWGLAIVADVRGACGREVRTDDLAPLAEHLAEVDFLLLRTGWEDKFGGSDYLLDFPTLSRGAAKYALSLGIRGVGVDALSADSVQSEECPIHKILLDAGALIIENLCGLEALPVGEPFILAALPLPLEHADGAPARVMALLENSLDSI